MSDVAAVSSFQGGYVSYSSIRFEFSGPTPITASSPWCRSSFEIAYARNLACQPPTLLRCKSLFEKASLRYPLFAVKCPFPLNEVNSLKTNIRKSSMFCSLFRAIRYSGSISRNSRHSGPWASCPGRVGHAHRFSLTARQMRPKRDKNDQERPKTTKIPRSRMS